MTTFRGELQGGSGPGFSWLLFDGAVGGSLEPKTSFATYTITQEDKAKVSTIDTLRPEQNGWHFADNIFKYIFLDENFDILMI